MSDFLLDFRPPHRRSLDRVAQQLRFSEDAQATVLDEATFGLVITQTGDAALWAPYRATSGSWAAVAGRPAFEETDWGSAAAKAGIGGLASKIVLERYERLGVAGIEGLNGNCVAFVHDAGRRLLHVVTDCCGVFPAFEVATGEGRLYCSHPDVLAENADERHRLDETSLAEFILSGTVTPPYSYYQRIRAAEYGTRFTFDLHHPSSSPTTNRHFSFSYRGNASTSEDEMAQALANALRRAVQRRTLPRFGVTGVALSGGLDSRTIMACSNRATKRFAFCCYDEPNREFRTAEAVARSSAVRFLALRRAPEYYADHAESGVRISGGMGSFANNHFLGALTYLKSEGMQQLLTGCYCDYLFKGLPLNRRYHWLTRREELASFRHQFYFTHYQSSRTVASDIYARWESRIPRRLQEQNSDETVFEVEARRTFPLCYEGDNQQRVVPQRLTGWSPPFVDRELLDLYCQLPYHYKLNRAVFRKAALAVLDSSLRAIPDANTSMRPDASAALEWLGASRLRWQRKFGGARRAVGTDGSWPNWQRYITNSQQLQSLWSRPNPDAMDLFRRVLGPDAVPVDVRE